jgi:hypothetical protein
MDDERARDAVLEAAAAVVDQDQEEPGAHRERSKNAAGEPEQ